MSENFNNLFLSDEEIKNNILSEFAEDFFNEVQKLVTRFGKEEFMKMIE